MNTLCAPRLTTLWLGPTAGAQRLRASQSLLAVLIYVAFAAVQHAEVMAGLVDLRASMWLSGMFLTGALGFYLVIRLGLNEQFADPSLTLSQMVLGVVATVGSYSITSTGVVQGWSADPDTGSQSINVHFYAVTPSGAFTFIGGTGANLAWAGTGYPGNHGFQWTIPAQYRNGQLYKLYAYGLDTSGLGENGELTGSPQTPIPFQLYP